MAERSAEQSAERSAEQSAKQAAERAVRRIAEMECCFDMVNAALEQSTDKGRNSSVTTALLRTLYRYYTDGRWLHDYELDEAGLLPAGLKRGVLSQDGIDTLLEKCVRAGIRFR